MHTRAHTHTRTHAVFSIMFSDTRKKTTMFTFLLLILETDPHLDNNCDQFFFWTEEPHQGLNCKMSKQRLSSGLYYKIYDVVFTPSYTSKEISVKSIHRYQLSSVRPRKYNVVNFIIQATGEAHTTQWDCPLWRQRQHIKRSLTKVVLKNRKQPWWCSAVLEAVVDLPYWM